MVVIKGIVRDAKKSNESLNRYVDGVAITYGETTTSSVGGYFEISSAVVDTSMISVSKLNFVDVPTDLISFGKKFDPNSTLSGTILNAVSVSGQTGVTTLKIDTGIIAGVQLVSGAYVSSYIRVISGTNSGQVYYVLSNTETSMNVMF